MATEPERVYPSELPVLALRQTVVFPLTIQPLAINRAMSIETVNHALAGDRLIFLALQTNDKDEPESVDLHTIGTIAAIRQMAKVPNGGIHIIVEGLMREKAEVVTRTGTAGRATVDTAPEAGVTANEREDEVGRAQERVERGGAGARGGAEGGGGGAQDANRTKGECVVLVEGAAGAVAPQDATIQHVLEVLMRDRSLKQAVKLATGLTRARKNDVYDIALQMDRSD